jgi:hypothetical protein
MTAKLGFERVLVDGGFGGMQGVDYTPMHLGKAEGAVAAQPYWWRFWRTLEFLGIRIYGECTVGWKGGNVVAGGPADEYYPWMFQMGWYIGCQKALQSPEQTHRLYQLYNSTGGESGTPAVRRYARKFFEAHRAPKWIELRDLRQLDPVAVASPIGESPVAGVGTRTTEQENVKIQVRPWTWSDAVWHFEDGTSAVYPCYEKINWNTE